MTGRGFLYILRFLLSSNKGTTTIYSCEFTSRPLWGVCYVVQVTNKLWQVEDFYMYSGFPTPPINMTTTIKQKYCWIVAYIRHPYHNDCFPPGILLPYQWIYYWVLFLIYRGSRTEIRFPPINWLSTKWKHHLFLRVSKLNTSIWESARITHTKIKHMPPERKPPKFPNLRYKKSEQK